MTEPPYTCPMLDGALREHNKIRDALDYAASEIEAARTNASALREWGQYWENAADELEAVNDTLRDRISDLEDKIQDLEREKNELEEAYAKLEEQVV